MLQVEALNDLLMFHPPAFSSEDKSTKTSNCSKQARRQVECGETCKQAFNKLEVSRADYKLDLRTRSSSLDSY